MDLNFGDYELKTLKEEFRQ